MAFALTRNPRLAAQFRTKQAAALAAKRLGWLAKDATPIEIMGLRLWAIADDHGNFVARDGYVMTTQP